MQLLGSREPSLPISSGMAAGQRYEFDLIAAGRAPEAIERSGFLPSAVIADDEAIDAHAEGTCSLPLPGPPRLQTWNPKEGDNLIHLYGSLDLIEVDAIRFRAHGNLLYVTE